MVKKRRKSYSRVDERHVCDACERLRYAGAGLAPPDDDDPGRRGHGSRDSGGAVRRSSDCRGRDRGRQLGRER